MRVQQGLEIHGLEEHGPWRYTVFNWIPKHLRYTVFGQKPCRYTVFVFMKKNMTIAIIEYEVAHFWATFFLSQVHVPKGLTVFDICIPKMQT